MYKFKSEKFQNKLELLDYSKFRYGYLNRQIIILLMSLKLDQSIFSQLQKENFEDLKRKDFSDGNIFAYINNDHQLSPTKQLL